MKKQPEDLTDAAILRQKAEELLKLRTDKACLVSTDARQLGTAARPCVSIKETDLLKLIHELEVHQIELEMQNAELVIAKEKAEIAEEKYTELYDYAPSGYLSLTKDGNIRELNFAAAKMLGKERSHLQNSLFGFFVSADTKPAFNRFLEKVFSSNTKETCEVMLTVNGRPPMHVILSGICQENGQYCKLTTMDITERKKSEETLRHNQERFRIAQEMSPDGFTILRPVRDTSGLIIDFTWIYENPAVARMNGTDPEEVVGKHLLELFPGHCDTPILKAYQQVAESGKACMLETEYSGETITKPISFRIVVVPMEEDIAILTQDITERKQSEQALVHFHELMRYVIENNQSAIAIHDKDLKYIYVSQRYLHDYKVKEKDIIGKHHYEVFPDLPQKWRDVHQKALSGVISRADNDSYPREDGTLEWTRWECRPWYEADDSIGGIIVYTEVITERKQAEEALHKSEENLSITLNSIGDGVISTDINGLIANMNPVAEKLCGWELTDALGKPLKEVFKIVNAETRQNVADPVQRVLENGEIIGLANHTILISKDGNEYQIADSAAPIKNKEGKISGVVLVFSDRTEKYAAEVALKENEERLNVFFSQSLDGFFFMMLDEPVEWNDAVDKEKLLDYVFENQRITKANQAMLNQYGATEKEFLGLTPNQLFSHDIKHGRAVWKEFFDKGKLHYDTREKKFDGTDMIVEGDYICLYDSQNRITGHFGIQRDVTEYRQSSQKLKQAADHWSKTFDAIQDGIAILDSEQNVVQQNEAFQKIVERSSRNQSEKKCFRLIHGTECPIENCPFVRTKLSKKRELMELVVGESVFEVLVDPVFNDNQELAGAVHIMTDITERKQIEVRLRESELKYRSLIESSSDAIFCVDEKGEYKFTNHLFASTFGKTPEYFIRKTFWDVYDKAQADNRYEATKRLFRTGVSESLEVEVPLQDKTMYFWATTNPIKDESGKVILNLTHAADITKLKLAEKALRESESTYRNLIEKMPDGVYKTTPNGKVVELNPAILKILGYSKEELMDIDIAKELYFDPAEREKRTLEGMSNELISYRLRRKDGTEVWVEDNGWYTLNDSGEILFHQGVMRDITERKQAEIERREKEVQYHNLANLGLALIWTSGTDKLCNYFNDPWLKFTGRTLEQELGNGWTEGVHHEDFDRCLETYVTAFENKKVFEMEYRLLHVSGKYRWILDLGSPNYNSSGEFIGFIGYCFDITERKHIEQELVKAKLRAEESDRLKSAFLANMSHEIRTPMNGILGFADLLKEPGLTGEEQQNYIKIIEKSGKRMLNIINDIIDISKIEAGLMEPDISESNINEQIEYIYTFFKPEAETKGINLSFKKTLPAKNATIRTDREKVYAILTNLVKNAIKYTHEGSVEMGCVMAETGQALTLPHQTFLQIYVKDSGIGVPKDRQEAIFERFVQADIEDRKAYQGAGLGLAITKAYVEMLGGKIWVESDPDGKPGVKGSTFYFTLPYNPEPEKTKAV